MVLFLKKPQTWTATDHRNFVKFIEEIKKDPEPKDVKK